MTERNVLNTYIYTSHPSFLCIVCWMDVAFQIVGIIPSLPPPNASLPFHSPLTHNIQAYKYIQAKSRVYCFLQRPSLNSTDMPKPWPNRRCLLPPFSPQLQDTTALHCYSHPKSMLPTHTWPNATSSTQYTSKKLLIRDVSVAPFLLNTCLDSNLLQLSTNSYEMTPQSARFSICSICLVWQHW